MTPGFQKRAPVGPKLSEIELRERAVVEASEDQIRYILGGLQGANAVFQKNGGGCAQFQKDETTSISYSRGKWAGNIKGASLNYDPICHNKGRG